VFANGKVVRIGREPFGKLIHQRFSSPGIKRRPGFIPIFVKAAAWCGEWNRLGQPHLTQF